MIPRKILAQARTPEDGEIELAQEGNGLAIYADDRMLMSSRAHGSEEEMAKIACRHLGNRPRPRVLVGGLGLGYTLRATLDALPPTADVVCAELIEAIAEWHTGPLGPLANHPLRDPRVNLHVGDVTELIKQTRGEQRYDAILLDVDNGPIPFTVVSNWWLYAAPGLDGIYSAMQPGGVVVVWSAGDDSQFTERMRKAGFNTHVVYSSARTGKRKRRGRGEVHALFVGRRPAPGTETKKPASKPRR